MFAIKPTSPNTQNSSSNIAGAHLHSLACPLEGNNRALASTVHVASSGVLALPHLEALRNGSLAAVRIPGFYSVESSGLLAEMLLQHPDYSNYLKFPDVGRVHYSYVDVSKEPNLRQKYFDNAKAWTDELNQMAKVIGEPFGPIEKLVLQLQAAWGHAGVEPLKIGDRECFSGLVRVFKTPRGGFAHQDFIHREGDDCDRWRFSSQLTANIYLKVPENPGSGVLNIWNRIITDEEASSFKNADGKGYDIAKIGPPDVAIKPEVGELIVFNPHRVHAIGPCDEPRVAASTFMGFEQKASESIKLWS